MTDIIQSLIDRGLSPVYSSAYKQFGQEFDKLENTTSLDGIKKHKIRMYAVEQSTKIKDFTEILEKINKSIPAIIKICCNPKSHLKSINEIRPIDTVKRIGYEAIPYLASHSEDWLARTASGLKPARLFSRVEEEDFQIYENRVVKTLIDKIIAYLIRRISDLERKKSQLDAILSIENQTNSFGFDESFSRAVKILLANELSEDTIKTENLELAEKLLKESRRLKSKFQDLKQSRLYKLLYRTKTVTNPLNETNILLLDKNYKEVFFLWKEIQKQIALEKKEDIKPEKVNIEKQYRDFCYSLTQFALDSLGFEIKHKDIFERGNDNLRISIFETDNSFSLKLKDIKKRSLSIEQGLKNSLNGVKGFEKFSISGDKLYWENDTNNDDIESFCKKIKPESNKQEKDKTQQRQYLALKTAITDANSNADKVKEKHIRITPLCCEIEDETYKFEKCVRTDFSSKSADTLNIIALPRIEENEQKVTNYAVTKNEKTAILPLTLFDINSYRRIQKIILSLITDMTEGKCTCCGSNTYKTSEGYHCKNCGIITTATICSNEQCKSEYKYLHYSTPTEEKLREMKNAEGFFNKDGLFQYKDIVDMEIKDNLSLAPICPKCNISA